MVQTVEVRRRCRVYAERFNYPLNLFDRFPMYVFRYFHASDVIHPNASSSSLTQLNIITVFMIINHVSADLMMAFYSAGDQDLDTVLRLQSYFTAMWGFYRSEPEQELFSIFGTFFAFHCETRTLRRVDMSLVNYRSSENTGPFIPNVYDWRRSRAVRHLIRTGQFRVEDDYDLLEVRNANRDGLRLVGRANRNQQQRRQ